MIENKFQQIKLNEIDEIIGNNLEGKVDFLQNEINKIDENKLNSEQKDKFSKIKEKIGNITRKTLKAVKILSFVGSIMAIGNYQATHSKLEITKNADGTNNYKHEDKRTTHLLNVLAGKEKFTEEDVRDDYDAMLQIFFNEEGVHLSKNIKDLSIDELDEIFGKYVDKKKNFADENTKKYQSGDLKKEFFKEIERLNKVDTSEYKPSKDIYELVWKMEQECGNPKMRFLSDGLGFTPVEQFKGAYHYSPIKNTIFIDPYDFTSYTSNPKMGYFIPEMSHAKQYNENQIGTWLKVIADYSMVFKNGGFNLDSLGKYYHQTYKIPGSMEHEAHSVIEPYLMNKYKLFVKNE